MKCPSAARTAGCGSSRSGSKNAGMASLTASRFNDTCIDLHYCAVRLLSDCVAPFFLNCVETGPWSSACLEVRPRTPLQKDSALLRSSLFHDLCRFVSSSSGGFSVGEEVPLPRPRIQVVHGTVPQKCARNTHPAPSGILYRPAIGELRCHPLPTSSTRAPEVTPN